MKRFVVFDIDGTLIRWQLYHAVADALAKRGHISPEDYAKLRDARMIWKRREKPTSFKDYEKELIEIYEQVLRSLSTEQFEEATDAVFTEYKEQVYIYTRNLIKQLKANDYLLFAISGSQIEIVEKVAEFYGFDDCVGTVYVQKSKRFTGAKIIGSADKAKTLQKLIDKHNVVMEGSVAVGDSASDIPMLEMVEQPIVFNPERQLFDYAQSKGWKIVVERKNMVYEMEKRSGKYELVKTNIG